MHAGVTLFTWQAESAILLCFVSRRLHVFMSERFGQRQLYIDMTCKSQHASLLLSSSCNPLRSSLRRQAFQDPRRTKPGVWVCRSSSGASVTGSSGGQQLRITTKKVLKQLSSLNLAIGELAAIAGLSVIGTVIKQNETAEFYAQNYPGTAQEINLLVPQLSLAKYCANSCCVLQKAVLSLFGSSGSCNGTTFTQQITS